MRGLYPGRYSLPPVVAVAAYFDDSRKGGIYAVAGYVGLVDVWDDAFAPVWNATIKQAPYPITEFAASDCNSGMAEFRPPWTKEQRDGLTVNLVSHIVDQHMPHIMGIGAAVTLPNFLDNEAQRAKWERYAYLLCAGTVVSHVAVLCRRMLAQDSVLFVFDEQKGMQGKAQEMFDEVKEDVQTRGQLLCDVAGPLFRPSHLNAPLQAADLLAFETYKELENRSVEPPIKQRISLRRLVEGRPHYAHYYDAATLRKLKAGKVDIYADIPKVYNNREIPRD